jgi:predicted DNA-binding transcriptional regulator YafY
MPTAKPAPESQPKSPRGPTVTKLALRLSKILALLHQGDDIDKYWLAEKYKVSVRTIERDLSDRLGGIVEQTAAGRWQLVPQQRSTIPARHLHGYARMAGTEHLFPDRSLPYLLEQLETPDPRRATHVQPTPHEDLRTQSPAFAQLQAAIERHRECRFTYKAKPRHAQPYRLIHKSGVWYLAAEEAGRLKNFSVALIEGLLVDEATRFTPKRAHQDYINAKDDVWFTEGTTEVLLRVAPEAAHYFARRQLLPQQQHRASTDGSLLVTTQINHINQLLPVVRYWLPNVRIVEPKAWHEELVEGLKQALAKWGD